MFNAVISFYVHTLLDNLGYVDSFGSVTLLTEDEIDELAKIEAWLTNDADRKYTYVQEKDREMNAEAKVLYEGAKARRRAAARRAR
jgi:hypothetical protein